VENWDEAFNKNIPAVGWLKKVKRDVSFYYNFLIGGEIDD